MTSLPEPPASPADDPGRYVGRPAQEAEDEARAHGWATVRHLAPDAVITMEFLEGRLNFAVREGVVERCWPG